MSSPLALENRLILACARTDPDSRRIQELVGRGPDWQRILRNVERWSIAPLVYSSLQQGVRSDAVPQPVTQRLRDLQRRNTIHGIARRGLLRAALLRFAEAGVPVIVLKGAALATLVYPAPTLRTMRDLDLLIRNHDRWRADAVLQDLRIALGSPAEARHDTNDIPHLGPRGFSLLDVRDHIFSPHASTYRLPAAARIPMNDFWKRARPAEIEGVATLVFSHEDSLLHLALQLAQQGGFVGQLRALCDIAETCRRFGDAIDWNDLVDRAARHAVGKEVYYSLRLARELVGAGVPLDALTELKASFGRLPLQERITAAVARRALFVEEQSTRLPSRFYKLGMRVLATDRVGEAVRTTYRYLTQSVHARRRSPLNERGSTKALADNASARLPSAAIVLPIYRPRLEGETQAAVDRAIATLRHGDLYLVAPRSMDTSFYERRYGKPIVYFRDGYFTSRQSYSALLLADEFYAAFARYEYMLVTQDDVYVVRDDLPRWLPLGLDYIGAPWPYGLDGVLSMSTLPGVQDEPLVVYVGNGGFSLRRISACRRLIAEFPTEVAWYREHGAAEDQFFSFFGQLSRQFVIPSLRLAADFCWETALPRMHALCGGQLPMAIHGYHNHDREFFDSIILPAALSTADLQSAPLYSSGGLRPITRP